MKKILSNNYIVLVLRILLLFVVFGICRIVFWIYNSDLIGEVSVSDYFSILKGALVFDSGSIFYVNLPFIVLSLIPFYFREKKGYQSFLMYLFLITNAIALLINIADIFYYPFKLARIASDDLRYAGESNMGGLMLEFLKDYWGGVILWIVLLLILYFVGFKLIRFQPGVRFIVFKPVYYGLQIFLLVFSVGFAIVAIRGYTLSAASFPISMSDATLFVRPNQSSLILSNPFCLLRTIHKSVDAPKYMSDEEAEKLFSPVRQSVDSGVISLPGRPNIMLIVLESFGSAHIKSLSDQFAPDAVSFTPFLDSLFNHGLLFTNAYQSGGRSIDAMPAMWGSIPSFKKNFLSMPQSVGTYHALPACLKELGYTTVFLHGAARTSMSFVAFGEMAGIEKFYSREDYEERYGKGDFDGKWGIWDHKFMPFVEECLNELPQPFFATFFSLSSHHPFILPPGMENRFPEGKEPVDRVIAYSDYALSELFKKMEKEPWFDNTLFIITADHGSGADNEKYLSAPYNYAVPVFFYMPSAGLAGRDNTVMAHVDIMPTLLAMLGYDKPFFAFGRDVINVPESQPFVVNYNGNVYNVVTDSLMYQFSDKELVGVYNYRTDYLKKDNLKDEPDITVEEERYKAYIQYYYLALKNHKYIP